jgi:anti-sigma factor RsiW
MTSKFEGFESNSAAEDQHLGTEYSEHLTSDSFELLSAYIDGELSPWEKAQVQKWLDTDPQFQRLYIQLLTLQGQIQHLVTPSSQQSTAEITTGVFQSIRHRHRRRKLIWGVSAIAASLMAGISGIIPGFSAVNLSAKLARVISPDRASSQVMLAVAVDQPAIYIPKSIIDDRDNLDLEPD